MNKIINLVVGDWSGDGHEKREIFTIRCNIDSKSLKEAYFLGTQIIGFDLSKEVAWDYQDSIISKKHLEILQRHGQNWDWDSLKDPDDDEIEIVCDDYVDIWMFIASLGNPHICYEVVPSTENSIYIGGYGLFF